MLQLVGVVASQDGSGYALEVAGDSAPGYIVNDAGTEMGVKAWRSGEGRMHGAFEEKPEVHVEHLR